MGFTFFFRSVSSARRRLRSSSSYTMEWLKKPLESQNTPLFMHVRTLSVPEWVLLKQLKKASEILLIWRRHVCTRSGLIIRRLRVSACLGVCMWVHIDTNLASELLLRGLLHLSLLFFLREAQVLFALGCRFEHLLQGVVGRRSRCRGCSVGCWRRNKWA